MIRIQIPAVVGFCLIAFLSAMAQTSVPMALSADPSATVITLDWLGYWQSLSRKNPNPALTIRKDGTVVVTDPTGVLGDLQGKLSLAELQDLVKFVVQEKDFFAINAADISSGIAAEETRAGQRVVISDAGVPVIRIKTADNEKEVRFYALAFYARRFPLNRFPSMKALDNLNAIEQKLTRIAEDVKGGGKSGVAAGLADANAYLARERPNLPLFTADDYSRTMISPNGRTMEFVRDVGGGSRNFIAIQYRPGQPPEFRFSVYGPPPALFGPAVVRD
jgi:hypothetical protein